MKDKKAIIITKNKYPNGNAGAVRQHIFSKMLVDIGFCVKVIGMGESTEFSFKEYDSIKYISLRSAKSDLIHKILNHLFFTKRMKKLIKEECPTLILVIDIPFGALSFLKKYTQKYNIPLIHDSVEWYSSEEFKLGRFSPEYIHKDLLNRYIIDKNMRVVAISKFLENHFKSKGIATVRIPFILDVKNITCKKNLPDNKIVIVYAGTIGKKDYFDSIIEAMSRMDKSLIDKIELRIIGCNLNSFVKCTDISESQILNLGNSVKFLGRQPREMVIKNLEESNFTILIRPDNLRYAQAGFPTKVTESLSYATPVIANITSDLGDYLSDNYNSVIVKTTSAESMLEAFNRVVNMDKTQLAQLCVNARNTAEKNLDYRCFSEKIKKIITKHK